MYIIDSNILIESKNKHFKIQPMHEFWDWMVSLGERDIVKIPEKVYSELHKANDELYLWMKEHKEKFYIPDDGAITNLKKVLEIYELLYKNDISDEMLESMQADPYIISHAITNNGIVVSNEFHKEKIIRSIKGIKIPTVCEMLGVKCLTLPQFLWELRNE